MSEHFTITADQGHLKIFTQRQEPGQMTPTWVEVQAADFPQGLKHYTDRESDVAGRFQGSKHQGRATGSPTARTGMSIDERLPMQREEERRRIKDVAESIEAFLAVRPNATWDFAAGPSSHNAVLEALTPGVRGRLKRSIAKDIVSQPIAELREHFEQAGAKK